jgi:opacity protein-like surface antigen
MSRKLFVVLALTASTPIAASTLAAQWTERPYYRVPASTLPAFQISPYVGYIDFGRYVNGKLGQDIALDNGPIFGGEASLSLTRNVALFGELGYAKSQQRVTPNGYSSVFSSNNSGFWVYDGGLQLMAPFRAEDRHWVVPFVQVGAGGINYRLYNFNTGNTNTDQRFAWNGGVGIDYHFTRQVGLRLMAKDYIAMFNVKRSEVVTPLGGTPTTALVNAQTNNNNYAFTAGLNIGF